MTITQDALVLLCRDEYFKTIRITEDSCGVIEGTKVSLKNAIGLPYGTMFSIGDGEIHQVTQPPHNVEENNNSDSNVQSDAVELKDNRHISDTPDNQKLDYSDIQMMYSSGMQQKDILDEIIKGNVNFSKKNKYSQEKYLTKKKKRYLGLFSIEQPRARILCELYSKLRRDKIMGLRFDTVCHMLTVANVHAGSSVLVVETCAGLLLGAILERLGGVELGGSVVQFFHGTAPPRPEINPFAASAYEKQVCPVALIDVVAILTGSVSANKSCAQPTTKECLPPCAKMPHGEEERFDAPLAQDPPLSAPEECPSQENGPSCRAAGNRGSIRLARKERAYQRLMGPDAIPPDALIVATRFHPVDLTLLLLQFLPIGKPFVVFCQFLQPLVELYNALKQRGGVALLRLTDTWFRSIQVLPNRSHPDMMMTACGGYLLNGYTVDPELTNGQLLDSGIVSSAFLQHFC